MVRRTDGRTVMIAHVSSRTAAPRRCSPAARPASDRRPRDPTGHAPHRRGGAFEVYEWVVFVCRPAHGRR